MDNLQQAINETLNRIEALKREREAEGAREYARIDKEILKLELRAKRLKESVELQEQKAELEAGSIDSFTRAKIHVGEIVDQVSKDGGDFNSDSRLAAASRLSTVIDQLEFLKMYEGISEEAAAFPDNDTFINPFTHYVDEYNERIKSAKKDVETAAMEVERIEAALADAINAGNAEEIINYSDALETARKNKNYLMPAVHAQESQNALPDGVIKEAWANICSLYRNEYEMRLEIIKTAREIYESACNELIAFDDRLKYLRETLQDYAKAHSFSPDQITIYNNLITADIELLWLKYPEKAGEKAYTKLCFDKSRMV